MTNPTLSILMPVYNAEKYLAQAVDSILKQTYTDFEFLITDDASTDQSFAILRRYAQSDPRIKLTKQEKNVGLQKALNQMLKEAQGKYIARMDADDIALPNRFTDQVKILATDKEVIAVGGAFNLIDEKSRFLTVIRPPQDNDTIQEKALAGHTPICHPSVMMRREAVLQVGGYDESLKTVEDLDLFLKLGEIGELRNLQESVISYRLHGASVSETKGQQQRREAYQVCKRAWKRRGIEGKFEASELWRPGRDRASRYQFTLKYGWWAWNSGERKTALIYAVKALQIKPWGIKALKLLRCALFKPVPTLVISE